MPRKAIFKRVFDAPITINIDGKPRKILKNDMFVSSREMIGSFPGIEFIRYCDEIPTITSKRDPVDEWKSIAEKTQNSELNMGVIFQNTQFTPEVTPEVVTHGTYEGVTPQVVTEIINSDDDETKEFEPVEEEKPVEEIKYITAELAPPVNEETIRTGTDVLLEWKKKDNRSIMVLNKKEIKKILTEGGVDFSHLEDDRNVLYKFLIGILKSL